MFCNPNELNDLFKFFLINVFSIKLLLFKHSSTLKNLEIIKKCGYDVLGHFPLPEDAWWEFYYNPLQKRLKKLKVLHKDNPEILERINEEE